MQWGTAVGEMRSHTYRLLSVNRNRLRQVFACDSQPCPYLLSVTASHSRSVLKSRAIAEGCGLSGLRAHLARAPAPRGARGSSSIRLRPRRSCC